MKKAVLTVLCISFLLSLSVSVPYLITVQLDSPLVDRNMIRAKRTTVALDHPANFTKLSPLDKIFFADYVVFFIFLIIVPILLLVSAVVVLYQWAAFNLLGTKNRAVTYIFSFWLLSWTFCILATVSVLPRFSGISNALAICLYVLSAAMIFVEYHQVRGGRRLQRLVVPVSALFILLIISLVSFGFCEAKFAASSAEKYVLLASVILVMSAFTGVLCCHFLHDSLVKLCDKVRFFMGSALSLIVKPIVVLILLVSGTAVFGFLWENRKTRIDYKKAVSEAETDRNVILIVIDALRSDHLGCYGYHRQTSPNLDALAGEGAVFETCYAQSSWTLPSVASILTSLYPTMHGTTLHGDKLPDEVTTIAEILKEEGYITYGYVANPNIKSIFNFNQGFDFFDDYLMRDRMYYAALRCLPYYRDNLRAWTGRSFTFSDRDNIKLANERIVPWLKRYSHENFFMYIHYMDPHRPYSPPKRYRTMYPYVENDIVSKYISLYDGEIRFADEYMNKLLDTLKLLGIYDKTLIVITSDHGEAFGEHGDFEHGKTIYQEQLKVPLIMKFTGSIPPGKVVKQAVRLIDVVPTILDVLGVTNSDKMEGSSLLPLIEGDSNTDSREDIFVEENLSNKSILDGVISHNRLKYVNTKKSEVRDIAELGSEELYDLETDPGEFYNLIKQKPESLKLLRRRLAAFKEHCEERAIVAPKTKLDSETIRQLKSLGYLH